MEKGLGQWWPSAGLGELSIAVPAWDLPKEVTIIFITSAMVSVTLSCPTLCNPVDCSTPGSLSIMNSWSSLKLMSSDSMMPSTISSTVVLFSSCLQSLPLSGSFPISQFFTSGGQSIGPSASASVLPMNI